MNSIAQIEKKLPNRDLYLKYVYSTSSLHEILPALRDVNKYVFVTITTENSTALTSLHVGAHDSDQANSVQYPGYQRQLAC